MTQVNGCKALFLDRDGVINEEKDYVYKVEGFDFVEGIFDLCLTAQQGGFVIVVITNQAGIGRGYYSEADFHQLTDWMLDRFKDRGIEIAGVYFCPDHPVHGLGQYKRDSLCRKPNSGMILDACRDLNIDPAISVLLGDKESDIQAGKNAGVKTNLFLRSDRTVNQNVSADKTFDSVKEVAEWLKSAL